MKEDKKIPVNELFERLQQQMNYEEPEKAFDTFLRCWCRHPEYPSPCFETLRNRENEDGYKWLKEEEIPFLEAYIGRPLR